MKVLGLGMIAAFVLIAGVAPAAAASVPSDAQISPRLPASGYGCGTVKVPAEEGGKFRMKVIKFGPVGCAKARKVWVKFMTWYARNTQGGKVRILGFRCRTDQPQINRCVKGRSEVRGY